MMERHMLYQNFSKMQNREIISSIQSSAFQNVDVLISFPNVNQILRTAQTGEIAR